MIWKLNKQYILYALTTLKKTNEQQKNQIIWNQQTSLTISAFPFSREPLIIKYLVLKYYIVQYKWCVVSRINSRKRETFFVYHQAFCSTDFLATFQWDHSNRVSWLSVPHFDAHLNRTCAHAKITVSVASWNVCIILTQLRSCAPLFSPRTEPTGSRSLPLRSFSVASVASRRQQHISANLKRNTRDEIWREHENTHIYI